MKIKINTLKGFAWIAPLLVMYGQIENMPLTSHSLLITSCVAVLCLVMAIKHLSKV